VAAMPPVRAEVVEYDGQYNRPITLWKTSRHLRNVVERLKPELVHSHGWDAAMIAALALGLPRKMERRVRGCGDEPRDMISSVRTLKTPLAAILRGESVIRDLPVPHVIHIHTTDVWLESNKLKHQMRRALTRWMFNRPATTVVAVSDAARQHWCRILSWPLQSFRVILNGIDTGQFQPSAYAKRSNGTLTIGVAARLQPNKGLEELFCALAVLAKDDLHPVLLIAGEGGFRGALESRVEQLGLREQVKFLGFLHDMKGFYDSIDVAALSSLSGEGMPLFVLEAMSCGIPVVATDVGGTKEALRDGIDGLVVPAREPSALAAALRKLLQDPGIRQQMGMNARHRIESEFSRAVFFERVSGLYQDVMRQGISHHVEAVEESA
jgi:glycosyltransferase involved in cell wall biosynthesis